jgi:hypothetical protein
VSAKAKEIGEKVAGEYLLEKGWYCSDSGWRHPRLVWPWSTTAAMQLQKESEEGRQEMIHRMLRGERL